MIGEYFTTIQISVGEKLAMIISSIATTISGIAIGFYYSCILAACFFGFMMLLYITAIIWGVSLKKEYIANLIAVKTLGGAAEEILSASKLVVSFGQEEKEINKFMS